MKSTDMFNIEIFVPDIDRALESFWKTDFSADSFSEDVLLRYFEADLVKDQLESSSLVGFNFTRYRTINSALIKKYVFSEHAKPNIGIESIKERFRERFLSLADLREIYPGNRAPIEDVVSEFCEEIGTDKAIDLMCELLTTYGNRKVVVCSVLFTISHMEFEEISSQGQIMALAYLTNVDEQISEIALHAFQNWNNKQTLNLLYGAEPKHSWLFPKWRDAIRYIEENGY